MFTNTLMFSGRKKLPAYRAHLRHQWACMLAFALLALFALSACQFTQSSFSRTVSNDGSTFSAATLTLADVHAGKIPLTYAYSAFLDYQNQVQDLDQQLRSSQDSPNTRTVQKLITQAAPALTAIAQPCLTPSCHWHTQLSALLHASKLFLQVGGS
jgi:hypothetical protein